MATQSGTLAQDRWGQQITRLLRLAEQALNESRLTVPERGSAYYYYQRVLELDADNKPAGEGLHVIVGRYARMAETALARADYIEARQYVRRGLRVRPGDTKLLALKETVAALGP